jgi:hypothetical protein
MRSWAVDTLDALDVLNSTTSASRNAATAAASTARDVAPVAASTCARPFLASRAPDEMRPRSNLATYSSRDRTA